MIETEAADDGEDDEESDAEDDANDMQLAWEMLELAKLCYSTEAFTHRQQLAGWSHVSKADLLTTIGTFAKACQLCGKGN